MYVCDKMNNKVIGIKSLNVMTRRTVINSEYESKMVAACIFMRARSGQNYPHIFFPLHK